MELAGVSFGAENRQHEVPPHSLPSCRLLSRLLPVLPLLAASLLASLPFLLLRSLLAARDCPGLGESPFP